MNLTLITKHTSKIQHARIQSTGYSLLCEEGLKSKGIYQAQSFVVEEELQKFLDHDIRYFPCHSFILNNNYTSFNFK